MLSSACTQPVGWRRNWIGSQNVRMCGPPTTTTRWMSATFRRVEAAIWSAASMNACARFVVGQGLKPTSSATNRFRGRRAALHDRKHSRRRSRKRPASPSNASHCASTPHSANCALRTPALVRESGVQRFGRSPLQDRPAVATGLHQRQAEGAPGAAGVQLQHMRRRERRGECTQQLGRLGLCLRWFRHPDSAPPATVGP